MMVEEQITGVEVNRQRISIHLTVDLGTLTRLANSRLDWGGARVYPEIFKVDKSAEGRVSYGLRFWQASEGAWGPELASAGAFIQALSTAVEEGRWNEAGVADGGAESV